MKLSDFKSEDELRKMKIADIKAHVREYNDHYAIRGYSGLKKDQLINMVLTAQDRLRNAVKAKKGVSFASPPKKGEEDKPRPARKSQKKQKEAFVEKNKGKKKKTNPVPEQSFIDAFVRSPLANRYRLIKVNPNTNQITRTYNAMVDQIARTHPDIYRYHQERVDDAIASGNAPVFDTTDGQRIIVVAHRIGHRGSGPTEEGHYPNINVNDRNALLQLAFDEANLDVNNLNLDGDLEQE